MAAVEAVEGSAVTGSPWDEKGQSEGVWLTAEGLIHSNQFCVTAKVEHGTWNLDGTRCNSK
jgi:hypothetical protein